jgi:hypothetical protein
MKRLNPVWCIGDYLTCHRSMERSGVKCFHYTHVFDLTNPKGEKRRNVGKLNNKLSIVSQLVDLHFLLFVNILYPLSLLEGLNSPCDNNASAAPWKREPISDDCFPRMDKAVLSISGNVYKQQEMEIDKLTYEIIRVIAFWDFNVNFKYFSLCQSR